MTNDQDNELYRMIGQVQASVEDLKENVKDARKEIKMLDSRLDKLQLKSKGVGSVMSAAGLGGLLGGIMGYLSKFLGF